MQRGLAHVKSGSGRRAGEGGGWLALSTLSAYQADPSFPPPFLLNGDERAREGVAPGRRDGGGRLDDRSRIEPLAEKGCRHRKPLSIAAALDAEAQTERNFRTERRVDVTFANRSMSIRVSRASKLQEERKRVLTLAM